MKKIVLIVFCFCAVLSFSQELVTVKAIGNQTEEVTEFSEQNKQTPLLVAEVADESSPKTSKETTANVAEDSSTIIASQGFSMQSLWRGVLGMISLIIIAFLFSSNRKAIDWKKAAIGLSLQLVIAIGVLKIELVQSIFEFIGGVFIEILEYTKAGSDVLICRNGWRYDYIWIHFCLSSTANNHLLFSLNIAVLLFRDYSKNCKDFSNRLI